MNASEVYRAAYLDAMGMCASVARAAGVRYAVGVRLCWEWGEITDSMYDALLCADLRECSVA